MRRFDWSKIEHYSITIIFILYYYTTRYEIVYYNKADDHFRIVWIHLRLYFFSGNLVVSIRRAFSR
jgi:hypothetical protein